MGLGSDAPLTEDGYHSVAALKDHGEMEAFVRRTIEETGLKLDDEAPLSGFVPWYNGVSAVQSNRRLREELLELKWVSVSHLTGDNVALTEEGYQQLAALKSTPEVVKLAHRLLAQTDGTCDDEGRLTGLAVHYSGEVAVQSLAKLMEELAAADWVSRPTAGWWQPDAPCDGSSAEDRAKWLVENRGLREDAARWQVRREFPLAFGGGVAGGSSKFGERLASVAIPGSDKRRLRVEVRPADAAGVSLVAVHYSVNGGAELNFDIRKPDLGAGAWVHETPSGDGFPDVPPGATVRYWLYLIRNGVGEQEPADAPSSPSSRLEVTL